MVPVKPVQMNIYQYNTFRKDLSWLHLDDEPWVPGRQQVKDQQSYISVFVTTASYVTYSIVIVITYSVEINQP